MLARGVRSLAALAVRAWLRVYHRFTICGREHLPSSESFVLVANHCSHLDALCLTSAMPLRQLHRTFSAAAADHFFINPRRAAMAVLVVNALPFDREVHVRQSLRLCRELLAQPGHVLILFPEGSRSPNGRMRAFKNGIGLLVAGTNVPVIPCYLSGTAEALPKRAMLPRPLKIKLTIGPARMYADRCADKAGAAEVARDLAAAVEELGNQADST